MTSSQPAEALNNAAEGDPGQADSDAVGIPPGRSFSRLADDFALVIGLDPTQRAIKRTFDVIFASTTLILLLPLMVVISIAVAISSPGPPIYAGVRVGRGGRRFKVLKFRTMYRDAEKRLKNDPRLLTLYRANGFKLPPENDPRIAPLGRFLRCSSLDELPQLCNVLVGDMSVVGARPVVPDELPEYGPLEPIYLGSRPGLTGHWQIDGRGVVKFPERAYLDLRNVHDWTLRGDIRLVLKTIPAVLSQRGAY